MVVAPASGSIALIDSTCSALLLPPEKPADRKAFQKARIQKSRYQLERRDAADLLILERKCQATLLAKARQCLFIHSRSDNFYRRVATQSIVMSG